MIENLLVAALWIWGFHIAFSPGYVFGFMGDELDEIFGKKLSKPIHRCPICMASAHGTVIFILGAVRSLTLADLSAWIVLDWIYFVVALSGLNYLAGSALEALDIYIDGPEDPSEASFKPIDRPIVQTPKGRGG